MATRYGTRADADAYALARDVQAWAAASEDVREAALLRASDYIDGRYQDRFPGRRAEGRSQDRAWPRIGATDVSGEEIADDEIPAEVIQATFEAAIREAAAPGSLAPDFNAGALIKSERKKVGPIEKELEYATPIDAAAARPVVSIIDDILAGLLVSSAKASGQSVSFLMRA